MAACMHPDLRPQLLDQPESHARCYAQQHAGQGCTRVLGLVVLHVHLGVWHRLSMHVGMQSLRLNMLHSSSRQVHLCSPDWPSRTCRRLTRQQVCAWSWDSWAACCWGLLASAVLQAWVASAAVRLRAAWHHRCTLWPSRRLDSTGSLHPHSLHGQLFMCSVV